VSDIETIPSQKPNLSRHPNIDGIWAVWDVPAEGVMAVAMVVHDMPQPDNRVDLDEKVTDAWDLPAARITLKPHPNDLAMGRRLIDRNAEILDATGAHKVYRVYIDRITGNCSHQHGTTRMGHDPDTSVLDRNCRVHEVDNLHVVDGGPFPTATGANPTLTSKPQ
jgi:choline dehydrogenase-like flavoprotein